MALLMMEAGLRIGAPWLPPVMQVALYRIPLTALSERPKLPEPLWRKDDYFGSTIRRVDEYHEDFGGEQMGV